MSPPLVKSLLALGLKQSHEAEHKSQGKEYQLRKQLSKLPEQLVIMSKRGHWTSSSGLKCPVGVMAGATEASLAPEHLNTTPLHSQQASRMVSDSHPTPPPPSQEGCAFPSERQSRFLCKKKRVWGEGIVSHFPTTKTTTSLSSTVSQA